MNMQVVQTKQNGFFWQDKFKNLDVIKPSHKKGWMLVLGFTLR